MSESATKSEWDLRRDIVLVSRWMYDRQLVVARDGNVSCRLGDGTFLMTPSGCCKGTVGEDELVRVDMSGRAVEGRRKPTSEVVMHIAAYRERPDVNAVGVASGDAAALAVAIERLYDDDERRRALGEAGRADVEERFNARRMWQEIAAIVADAAGAVLDAGEDGSSGTARRGGRHS